MFKRSISIKHTVTVIIETHIPFTRKTRLLSSHNSSSSSSSNSSSKAGRDLSNIWCTFFMYNLTSCSTFITFLFKIYNSSQCSIN